MNITPYHSKYFAHELTKQCASGSIEKIAGVLADAQVDLNPYQIEAALFSFQSPLSKGAVLADEVGLGKTIEAGILLAQKWAEKSAIFLLLCRRTSANNGVRNSRINSFFHPQSSKPVPSTSM